MQSQILQRYPDADLRVYVVWLPVMPLDARFDVADLLVDGRATHFWDNERLVSDALDDAYGSPVSSSGTRSSCSVPMRPGAMLLHVRLAVAARSWSTWRR